MTFNEPRECGTVFGRPAERDHRRQDGVRAYFPRQISREIRLNTGLPAIAATASGNTV
jgi:hypothetical protein